MNGIFERLQRKLENKQQEALERFLGEFRSGLGRGVKLPAEWANYQETHQRLQNQMQKGTFPEIGGFVPPTGQDRDEALLQARIKKVQEELEALKKIEAELRKKESLLIATGRQDRKELKRVELDHVFQEITIDKTTLEGIARDLERELRLLPAKKGLDDVEAYLTRLDAKIDALSLDDVEDYLEDITVSRGENDSQLGILQAQEIYRSIIESEPDDALATRERAVRAHLGRSVEALVSRQVDRDPDQAYQNIRDFRRELALLESHPLPEGAVRGALELAIGRLEPGVLNLERLLAGFGSVDDAASIRTGFAELNRLLERGREQLRILRERIGAMAPNTPEQAPVGGYLIERVDVNEILGLGAKDLRTFVDIFTDASAPINPWKPSFDKYPEHLKARAVRLIDRYLLIASTDPEIEYAEGRMNEAEAREFHRQKVRLWAWIEANLDGDLTAINRIPGGNSDIVLANMRDRGLRREDILLGVFDNPRYGESSRIMLRYAIDVMSRRGSVEKGEKGEILRLPDPDAIPGLDYASLANDSSANPKFKAHLRSIFVGNNGERGRVAFRDDRGPGAMIGRDTRYKIVDREFEKMDNEQFDIAWNLFYSFDLASVAWALRQKESQTKFHNTNMQTDYAIISYPWHFIAHAIGRYGFDNAYGNLLALADKYPDAYINSGVDTPLRPHNRFSPKRYMQNLHRLLLLNVASYMPIKGLRAKENLIKISDASVFPDFYDFLTQHLGGDKVDYFGRKEIKITPLADFMKAQDQWRDMLVKTVGALPADLFAPDGFLQKLTSSGIGIAKIVTKDRPVLYEEYGGRPNIVTEEDEHGHIHRVERKGDHTDFFAGMMLYWIGLGSSTYQHDGHAADKPEDRAHLAHDLYEKLSIGIQGGLKGLGASRVLHALHSTEKKETPNMPTIYNEVPEIVLPRTVRIPARREYMREKALYDNQRTGIGRYIPIQQIDIRIPIVGWRIRRMIPYAAGTPSQLARMNRIIENAGTVQLPSVFNRANTSTKTEGATAPAPTK